MWEIANNTIASFVFLELLLADLIALLIPLFLKYLVSCVILPRLVLILPLSLAMYMYIQTFGQLAYQSYEMIMFLLVAGSTLQLKH